MNNAILREQCAARDQDDPLKKFHDQFELPQGVIYLDGNSLGALPKATAAHLQKVITQEWGGDLIRSWNTAGWIDLPRRVGDKIARLIGADAAEVVVADSTSINLFKVLAAALKLNPSRRVILSEPDNFPTDLYMAQGLIDLLGNKHELRLKPADEIFDSIDADTAVVMLTQVNYRTGRMHEMKAITARAREQGALMIWDLAHSAGAVPVDLNGAGADFAIGCGYKYLNGGPGAPAFVFVAKRHQENFSQPLSGWMGHAHPFNFDWKYEPAEGIARYLCGTQAVLSMSALECGIDMMLEADINLIRAKSLAMTDLFIALLEQRCAAHDLKLVTPRDHAMRGSQVCLSNGNGYPMMQALIAKNVIGDFRAPDILRFGFTPLYLRYVDVWDAVDRFVEILETRGWDRDVYKQKAKVT
jgi:kynureninase